MEASIFSSALTLPRVIDCSNLCIVIYCSSLANIKYDWGAPPRCLRLNYLPISTLTVPVKMYLCEYYLHNVYNRKPSIHRSPSTSRSLLLTGYWPRSIPTWLSTSRSHHDVASRITTVLVPTGPNTIPSLICVGPVICLYQRGLHFPVTFPKVNPCKLGNQHWQHLYLMLTWPFFNLNNYMTTWWHYLFL